jgi:hypothetical protein
MFGTLLAHIAAEVSQGVAESQTRTGINPLGDQHIPATICPRLAKANILTGQVGVQTRPMHTRG